MSAASGWTGLDEALRAIDGLGGLAEKEVHLAALMDLGAPIAQDMADNCPRATGLTAEDFTVAEAPTQAIGIVAVDVGARQGKGGRSFVARWIEFGTVSHGAHPFMRPAADRARAGLVVGYAASLRKAYLSLVRRASK